VSSLFPGTVSVWANIAFDIIHRHTTIQHRLPQYFATASKDLFTEKICKTNTIDLPSAIYTETP
jgi:hypothetical protein